MRSEVIESILLCGIMICSLLSLGVVSEADLVRIALLLLAWSAGSTLVVFTVGAVIAIARNQRARAAASRAGQR